MNSTDGPDQKTQSDIWIYLSGGVALTGLFFNTVSIAYFFLLRMQSLGNRILLLLNSIDTLVCLFTFLEVTTRWLVYRSPEYITRNITPSYEAKVYSFMTFLILVRLTGELSALATCILTITRFLGVWKPFFFIREKAIAGAVGVYIIIMLPCVTVRTYSYAQSYVTPPEPPTTDNTEFVFSVLRYTIFLFSVLLVAITTVLTIILLRRAHNTTVNQQRRLSLADPTADRVVQQTRRATITTVILAVSFLVWNSINGAMLVIHLHNKGLVTRETYHLVIWLALPLNSALNPLIYLCRMRKLRKFLWYVLLRYLCCRERDNLTEPYVWDVHTSRRISVLPPSKKMDNILKVLQQPNETMYQGLSQRAQNELSPQEVRELRELFSIFDIGGTGRLTFPVLRKSLRTMGFNADDRELMGAIACETLWGQNARFSG
eukprot:sb/3464885/